MVLGLAFPSVGVDGALNQVPFACILEPQFRASCFPINLDQLELEKIFGNASCVHSPHMAERPEASFCEKCVETAHVVSLQHLCIADLVLPLNLQFAP